MSIAVAMIAHNEAHQIIRALDSVRWANQVVVVDTDSDDGTGELASQWGAEVIRVPNDPNLNVNKNIAISACTGDWVLVLDADEVITEKLALEIQESIYLPNYNGYLIPRRNFVWGRWLRFGSQYPDYQLRLFRKGKGIFPADHIHERLVVEGKVGKLREPMEHYPYPDLESMVRKSVRDARFEKEYLRKKGVRASWGRVLWFGILGTKFRLFRRLFLKGGFLDGPPGITMAFFDAFNRILRWFLLWEEEFKARKDGKS